MKKQFAMFLLRWLVNSAALWAAVRILSTGDFASSSSGFATFLLAGLALSLVNVLLRPIIVILSLPAILLTLGLFMLVVNGLLVYIAIALVPAIKIDFFPGAILAGMIVSVANYVLSGIMDRYTTREYIRD
ncbi:MAG: phage holin family protein [Candidatus Saccharimonadales bacterium]